MSRRSEERLGKQETSKEDRGRNRKPQNVVRCQGKE